MVNAVALLAQCAVTAVFLASAVAAGAQSVLRNGGLEEGAEGWGLPEGQYAIDETVAHSGTRSLRYHNEPGGPYLLAGQGLALEVGKCYRMSAWVRTEGIVSTDTGATISIEWSGREGYIGGSYPPGITGTSDWQPIVFVTGPVPEGVTGGHLIAYGRQGTSGTAWFDDLDVTELDAPLARFGFSDRPPGEKRGRVLAGLASPEVRLRADLQPAAGLSPEGLSLAATLYVSGTKRALEGGSWAGSTAELVVPTETLPFGTTQIEASLVTKADGRPVTSEFLWLEKRPLLSMNVVYPNSAGVVGVGPGGSQQVKARVAVAAQEGRPAVRYRARLTVLSEGQPAGPMAEATVTDRTPSLVSLSLATVPFGLHDLQCELFPEGSAEPVARASAVVTKADPAERPANATWIGPNRMLMVDGKPFVPVGFYILSSFETVFPADQPYRWQTGKLYPSYYEPILDRLSKSHFNCIMDYGSTLGGMDQARAFLDAAQERGVRAIFSVKDLMKGAFWEPYTRNLPWQDLREANRNVVRALREHPSLIAWYINDEVFQPEVWPGAVNVFRDTRETDPWHPTWAVQYDYGNIITYRQACDIIGTDPYTLMGDINFAARDWHDSRAQMPPEQPFWAVVQCFGSGYEFSRPTETREPTFEEERAATMAALAEGATGIIYYCYHSLQRSPRFEERFAELDRVAEEVQGLAPIIALPDARYPVLVESGTVSALTKQGDGCLHLLLASTMRNDQDVTLRLPRKTNAVRDIATGERLPTDGLRVRVRFKALDARTLEVR